MWRNAQKNCRSHMFLSSVSSRLGQLHTFGQPILLLPLEHKDCDVSRDWIWLWVQREPHSEL